LRFGDCLAIAAEDRFAAGARLRGVGNELVADRVLAGRQMTQIAADKNKSKKHLRSSAKSADLLRVGRAGFDGRVLFEARFEL
jgi:hypothetical protein